MATKKSDKKTDKKTDGSGAKAKPAGRRSATAAAASRTSSAKLAKPKTPKGAPVSTKARHPKARVADAHGGKAALAKALAAAVAGPSEDTDQVEARLKTASNAQLLRLQQAVTTVKAKWGNRDKLVAAIGTALNKSTDKDYLAKIATYSLPQLIDLAKSTERSARA